MPLNSIWPNSVLGMRWPSTNTALPIPVPKVSTNTTPSPPGDTEAELGDPGGVGVVEQDHRATDGVGKELAAVHSDPVGIDVGSREHYALPHHRGEGAPHRTVP